MKGDRVMSQQETVAGESPRPGPSRKPQEPGTRAEARDRGGRKSPTAGADPTSCPFCSKRWEDHNLVAVRECLRKLEEALELAERARIRASSKEPRKGPVYTLQ